MTKTRRAHFLKLAEIAQRFFVFPQSFQPLRRKQRPSDDSVSDGFQPRRATKTISFIVNLNSHRKYPTTCSSVSDSALFYIARRTAGVVAAFL